MFSALTMRKFPDDINNETFSMIYASMTLLLKETAADTKDEFYRKELAKCVKRRLESTKTKDAKEVSSLI